MRKLEDRIHAWRQQWAGKLSREQLDELEEHLREELDRALTSALDVAWAGAVAKLGDGDRIAAEFAKVKPRTGWLPARVVGFLAIGLTLLITALFPLIMRRGDLLLGTHVMFVTVGYVMTFLIGMLGACFAVARPFTDWHAGRSRALRRVAVPLTLFAGGCTLIGVLLGMRWASLTWGTAWTWDAKETGGLAVVVGNGALAAFLLLPRVPDAARMALALLGSLVVSLAWFHPILGLGWGATMRSYGSPSWAAAAVFVSMSIQVLLMVVVLAPRSWFARRA